MFTRRSTPSQAHQVSATVRYPRSSSPLPPAPPRCAARQRGHAAAPPSLPSRWNGLDTVRPCPSAKRTSAPLFASVAVSSTECTAPKVTPAAPRILRHSARSRWAIISSRIATNAVEFSWRAALVAKRAPDRFQEAAQLPLLVEERHQEPTSVAATVVIGERVRCLVARRAKRHRFAEKAGSG